MAVTDPWTIMAGGVALGGFIAGAMLGPLAQTYGSVRKASYVASALTVVVGVVSVIR